MESIYRQLQRKINTIGVGFPENENGYDVEVLKALFDEEEAEFALKMDRGLHTAKEFAESLGMPLEETERILNKMIKDGLVYYAAHNEANGEERQYCLISTYHGFFEWNVGRMDPSWVNPMVKANIEGLSRVFFNSEHPMFRYLPVRPELVDGGKCLDEDNMELYIKRAKKCAKTPCFCRQTSAIFSGKWFCKHNPEEELDICLAFDDFAHFFVEELGVGEYITTEEALEIMSRATDRGTACLVLNDTNVEGMCSCCSCCCGVIGGIRAFGPGYAKGHISNYYAVRDEEKCTNCGVCVKRCMTKALHFKDRNAEVKEVVFDVDRCIGCGLCVDTCEHDAVKLVRKPDEEIYHAPAKDYLDLNEIIAKSRRGTHLL